MSASLGSSSVPLGYPTAVYGSVQADPPMTQLVVAYDWGDATTDTDTTNFSPPSAQGMVGRSHTYTAGGTYTITVTATATYYGGGTDTASQTLTETVTSPPPPPPPLPVVSMAPVNVREGESGDVVFTRSGDTTNGLTVAYTVGGSATGGTDPNAGADYDSRLLTGTVTFAPGSDTATVTISAFKDQVYDPDEGVTLTIYPTDQYQLTGGAGSDTASNTIIDSFSTFVTSNSTLGTFDYDIPWADVDSTQATQTLPLNNFTFQFGGQTIDTSNATFTVAPVADFAYGDLVNIRFAVTFNTPIGGWASVSVSNDVATAVDANTLQPENDNVTDNPRAMLGIDFKNVVNRFNYSVKIWVKLEDGSSNDITINIEASTTAGGTRDQVLSALQDLKIGDQKLDVEALSDTRLKVKGTTKSDVSIVEFTAQQQNGNDPGIASIFHNGREKSPTAAAPPKLSYNGDAK